MLGGGKVVMLILEQRDFVDDHTYPKFPQDLYQHQWS